MEESGGQQDAPEDKQSEAGETGDNTGQENSNEGHEEAVREAVSVGSSEGDDGQATPRLVCDEWDEEPDEDYWTRVHGFTPQHMPYYDLTGQFDDFVHEDTEYDELWNVPPSMDRPFGQTTGRTMGCQTPYGWTVDPFCMLAPALEELQEGHPHTTFAKSRIS